MKAVIFVIFTIVANNSDRYKRNTLRISQQKCIDYSSAVFQNINIVAVSVTSRRIDKCGHKVVPLVVGGENAAPREFPHMALIGFDSPDNQIKWFCGGSLISERYVLTAAHCLHHIEFGDAKHVRIGELDLSTDTEDAKPEDFKIKISIEYPEYTGASYYNDIALLELDRDVNINPYKRPACLPTSFDGPEEQAIATGWGYTEWNGQFSNHLMKVTLDKFTTSECNESYTTELPNYRKLKNGILNDKQICAGSKNSEKDTCHGDSGGPLQIYHPTQYCMYSIIGITSFGNFCGSNISPGVYTRVYGYLDWIEKIVWGSS